MITTKTLTLMPPDSDVCQQCAVSHAPDEPHNQQSFFYRVWFHQQHGRLPTWADALAHCAPEVQAAWCAELEKRGIDVGGGGDAGQIEAENHP